MKLKRTFICLYSAILSAAMWAQTPMVPGTVDDEQPIQRKDRLVNFGVKGGFTSSLFLISSFNVDGVPVEEVQNNYKIGYFGSLFMRIKFNMDFHQPEISYNINRCNITFERPLPAFATTTPPSVEASITSSIHSIDFPVIYGYNIIKEGPYRLAVFGGPKIRYIWNKKSDITFDGFNQKNIREQLHPFNISFTTGVSVTISRIFFDFRYDIGLHNISKRVTYDIPTNENKATDETAKNRIRFKRRDNVLSFSFGVLF
ncbi:porin family protein [Bacteroides heparinolyticus]|uniref:porin family protein n=1 Tax=Prevotella heparinolytica TaxID=28113 RepID=UPI0028E35CA0|nr:porin family protein [Bacteroides heparinolyticus]